MVRKTRENSVERGVRGSDSRKNAGVCGEGLVRPALLAASLAEGDDGSHW